jgi:hypothetical protein
MYPRAFRYQGKKTHCLDIYNAQQVASGPEKVLQWSRLCAQNWYCKMVQRACCRNQACSAGGLLNLGHWLPVCTIFLRQIGYPALAINIFKIFFVGYSVYAKENVFCVGAWSVHKWGDRFACSIPGIQP